MKTLVLTSVLFFCTLYISAQSFFTIKGKVIDGFSSVEIVDATITVKDTSIFGITNFNGEFQLEQVPVGNYILEITHNNYESQNIPISTIETNEYDLGTILLQPSIGAFQQSSFLILSEDDLADDEQSSDNIAGLFQSSKDAYLRTAAFNFSQAYFRVRGYDSSLGTISINGIEMNKMLDGRPQWSNWGGLNDAFRNQESSNGIAANDYSFGTILGSTNFNTRASDYQKGNKISYAFSNKSYNGRIMANYASGLIKNDWAFVISASRRYAQEGYSEGTSYNAWSAFLAVEKKLNEYNSLNLTAFTTPNRRGKSSPNTQEVFDLKGQTYNSYWGEQAGENRNSRIKDSKEPTFMLTHFYEKGNSSLKTTAAFQIGETGNSRLGYFNAPNPDPTYWKNLPSNFLRYPENPDYANAYLAEQNLLKNGQINWTELYDINQNTSNAFYYLYEDRNDDTQFSVNSLLNTSINKNINLNAGINFTHLTSTNYSNMLDLFGSNGFIDIDQYAENEAQQNDLNFPNRVVQENDTFQYNYIINGVSAGAFTQLQATYKKVDYFAAIQFKNTTYQREGLYQNGTYPTNSFGKSEKLSFGNFSGKGGFTYKFNGRNLLNMNGAYSSQAPTIKNSFANIRVNNAITPTISNEKIMTGDASYIYRSPKIQSRLTGYFTQFKNATETSFFFAEGLFGDQADFINETLTDVEKQHMGVELSFEYQVIPTFKLFTAGSIGQFIYNNNPHIYVQAESISTENSDFGTAYLKNYKLSGSPQNALAVGFEYRDPTYWWFQANGSFLSNNYLDISPILRTNNFYLDTDGVPFIDDETGEQVTQQQVKDLLKQEKFDSIFLLDIVGGKSWKRNDTFLGIFAGINNVLGELYKTSGFEQARKASYPAFKQDQQLDNPIFSPKYWYGTKTTYYFNFYIRF